MKLISRRTLLLASASDAGVHASFAASIFSGIDTDNDGTISLDEAKAAASKVFDQLDHDHDGTLNRAELRGRILEQDWKIADPDNDKTLTKDEYLNYVETPSNAPTRITRERWTRRKRAPMRAACFCVCCARVDRLGKRRRCRAQRRVETRDVTRT